MNRRLEGKVIIVAGAGTGLIGLGNGKAAAVQFAREGAKVVCVDKDQQAADLTVDIINKEGNEAISYSADITNSNDISGVIVACLEKYSRIDVLHNNVGIISGKEILDTDDGVWDKIFETNVKGIFMLCKSVIAQMIENGGGCITNVSSIASHRPLPDAAYVSSKGSLDALTRYIASRYGRYNIRSNALLLGYIDTPLARPVWEIEKIRKINLSQVPLRRFASPWEVASVAAFLASDEASYINGVILPVDGGLCISM